MLPRFHIFRSLQSNLPQKVCFQFNEVGRKLVVSRRMFSKPTEWSSLDKEQKKSVIASLDSVVTDCDGVLWLGSKKIPGATEVMNGFKDLGKSIFFLTNNSTKSQTELTKKCVDMGFNTTEEDAIGTARLTALYLKSLNFNKKAYVIGGRSIQDELSSQGIDNFGVGPDVFEQQPGESVDLMALQNGIQEGVGAVVVGYDHHFSYPKMQKACTYLADPDCKFIATNTDERFPLPGKVFAPGCGAFVAAITVATGREPIVIGKPSSYAIDLVLKARGLKPERSLMIGDRCDTDIMFGNTSNMKTLLVLTGNTNAKLLEEFVRDKKTDWIPTYYTTAIDDLTEIISEMIASRSDK